MMISISMFQEKLVRNSVSLLGLSILSISFLFGCGGVLRGDPLVEPSGGKKMPSKQEKFAEHFDATIRIAQRRLDQHSSSDPLSAERLQRLIEILETQKADVLLGEITKYEGLFGPLKLVIDWGEPVDSELIEALNKIEEFFKANYSPS